MLAVVAPGQGAQAPGLLVPWLDGAASDAPFPAAMRWAAAVTGLDLIRLGTTGHADEVRDTAVAQPLLTATALACVRALEADLRTEAGTDPGAGSAGELGELAGVVAGHSVGELAAAAVAGALSPEAALVLARERGAAMAAACGPGGAGEGTGMSALLGGDPGEVDEALAALGLTAANRNGAGQVVAAGPLPALEKLAADPPAKARVRPLAVAGAFHTAAMAPAQRPLADLVAGVPVRDPRPVLLSIADGAPVRRGDDLLGRLVAQVAAPVRWDLCQESMARLGVTGLLELAPGGTLSGLAKRVLPGVEVVALRTPADLPAARDLVAAHAARGAVAERQAVGASA